MALKSDKYIYLVFSKTGTLLSKAILNITKNYYSHVSLSLDSSLTEMYSFGRINPDNPLFGGLIRENIYNGVFKNFTNSECIVYKVKISNYQFYKLQKEINTFLSEQSKYKYNILGLVLLLMDKPLKRKYYYFCSQFVSELLIKSSIYKSDKPAELISPNDLMLSINNKEFIYEGLVHSYETLDTNYNSVI
ncbi:MAG: hypothetical protein RSB70_03980 [Clostridium sp.]